ncbi:hypothetical protein Agabi119p4_5295 [Agaricus bisporus var. burnettii]|uniref:Succinate dehydrogenase cytochrome b560 subunit n=1 Tax=Agaricus bisporus var. burnettii TaxID=192524 RepID=A0A8H7KGD9_AGABI|nr:hypothetical protein Agabi119p4_5295 [Agaricus bisporus var. burnettii]
MMSTKALGIGPALRRTALIPRHGNSMLLTRYMMSKRAIQTESLPPSANDNILNKQRLQRPSSPHFTIYQPQLTWLGSIANRVTGAALSTLLYGFALAYLVAPTTFDSTHIIELVHQLPESFKYVVKLGLAAPFSFHAINGLRHLAWDTGKFLSVKGAYMTGYAVLGASAVSTVYLTFFM